MKHLGIAPYILSVIILGSCSNTVKEGQNEVQDTTAADSVAENEDKEIQVHPISHATFVLTYGDLTIYNDPNGGASAFEGYDSPDIVLLSDIHGDHMNQETLDSLNTGNTTFIMPQAVADRLPEVYHRNARILANGEEAEVEGINIKATPMYNLPETEDSRHPKGRGNGYVLTLGDKQVYIAGDTEDIPEMRSLENIDIAFIPMNMPYTMPVEQAAEGVIAFSPKVVYPYHYRGQGGLSDVNKFKELVQQSGKDIEVKLPDWYSQTN